MNMRRPAASVLLIALFLFIPAADNAQVSTGTIAGTITDATGAVTSGAKVTATNTATGIATTSESTAAGLYTVPNLQPGPYTVTVEAPGFAEEIANDINLSVGA